MGWKLRASVNLNIENLKTRLQGTCFRQQEAKSFSNKELWQEERGKRVYRCQYARGRVEAQEARVGMNHASVES